MSDISQSGAVYLGGVGGLSSNDSNRPRLAGIVVWNPGFLKDRRDAGLHGLENTLELLKIALDKSASLTREPAPWVSRISITLGLEASLTWEPAPWVSPRMSLGDGFGKGCGDALDFVTGLTWAVAESLEFGGSSYINVRIGILSERY